MAPGKREVIDSGGVDETIEKVVGRQGGERETGLRTEKMTENIGQNIKSARSM